MKLIEVSLTNACNYHCSYCKGSNRGEISFLDVNLAFKFIDAMAIALNDDVTISIEGDGEPTLHPNLVDFI